MSLKTWNDGEKSEVIQAIIESNFKTLGKYLSKYPLTLSTNERNMLTKDYLSDKLIVFDTDLEAFVQYIGGKWKRVPLHAETTKGYSIIFSIDDWVDGKITISYETHLVENPSVTMYMYANGYYVDVVGGALIDNENNITLESDIPFSGKVVIK